MKVQSPVLHPIQLELRKRLGHENYVKFMSNLTDFRKYELDYDNNPNRTFFESFGNNKEIISFAFPWEPTHEGWGFWNEIDKKWRNEN